MMRRFKSENIAELPTVLDSGPVLGIVYILVEMYLVTRAVRLSFGQYINHIQGELRPREPADSIGSSCYL
jgi:hypothetical protein